MTHSSPVNASREAIFEKAIRAVIDASGAYLPPDGISKDEFINRVLGATDNTEVFHALNIHAQQANDHPDDEDHMVRISALIARLQSTLDQFGDTCVYIRRGGLSWGAVALNREDDDRKHGVFDLQAQHDRDMEQRAGQVERLIADRNRWMERAMEAEAKAPSFTSPGCRVGNLFPDIGSQEPDVIRDADDIQPQCARDALAETIHKARWPVHIKPSPFADEDGPGREYCFRIADAVLALTRPEDNSPRCNHWPGQHRCGVCGMDEPPFASQVSNTQGE